MDRAVFMVKRNSPTVKKFFQYDSDTGISVKGEIAGENGVSGEADFFVEYDLKNLRPAGSDQSEDQFKVDFLVTETASGENRKDTMIWTIRDDDAGLLLSFDDDYIDAWRRGFDLLDAYGAKATFFIQGEAGRNDQLASFCAQARERGHDIGYHSAHHRDLTKVSRTVFYDETTAAAGALGKAGINFSSFAYPYGFWQPWMNEALQPRFGILRGYGVTFRFYAAGDIRNGFIISKAIDNIVYNDDGIFNADITMMLTTAKFLGSVLPLTTHDISENAKWGVKPERLELLLKTAGELKLKFYRYRDFSDTADR
jgi:peptidoglycan/xylan/chitin deacetylase (PgdA/CDA1 family)